METLREVIENEMPLLAVEEHNAFENELQQNALEMASSADIIVDSPEAYGYAGEVVVDMDKTIKKIEGFWSPLKKRAHEAWRGLCDKENEMLATLRNARAALVSRMKIWATEQEKQRILAEEKAKAEAKAREDEERKRLEEAAKTAESQGSPEMADLFRRQAESVIVSPEAAEPVISKTQNAGTGSVTQRKELIVEVSDLMVFLRAAVSGEGSVPLEKLVTVRSGDLKSWAKLHGVKSYPGLSIREEIGISAKTRR